LSSRRCGAARFHGGFTGSLYARVRTTILTVIPSGRAFSSIASTVPAWYSKSKVSTAGIGANLHIQIVAASSSIRPLLAVQKPGTMAE